MFRPAGRTRGVSLFLLLIVVGSYATGPRSHAAPGDVKRTLDAPCKYPTGLATDGRRLFVLDWLESRIYELSPDDGRCGRTLPAPTLRPQGLACGDGRLFVCDDRSGRVYVVNPDSGVVEHSFSAPGEQAVGLAWGLDGLFLLERTSRQIYKLTPDDGTILAYFPAPSANSGALAFDGRYLWAADRIRDELYLIDPNDGNVLGIVEAPGPYAAGLACLDGYLWNADFQTRKLYQIVLRDQPPYRLTKPRVAQVEMCATLHNYGPGEVRDAVIALALPENLPNQEILSAPVFTPAPTRVVTDRWGQRCALYELPRLTAGEHRLVSYRVTARVQAIRYLIFPEDCGTLADIPEEIRHAYTQDAARYRVDSPVIREAVRKVVGEEQNAARIARKLYDYLGATLEYELAGGWDVPEVVLKRGKGSCSEYTFAYIALCRAAGLPARYQGSVVVRGDDACVDDVFHRWAEVYLPNYGWVPVDPSGGDKPTPAERATGFGELPARYLITTNSGGPSEWLAWDYNGFARYQTTGYAKVEEEKFALWEPAQPSTAPSSPGVAPPTCKTP